MNILQNHHELRVNRPVLFCELFPEVTSLEMPLSGWGCLADMGLASRKNLHKVDGFCQDFKRFQKKKHKDWMLKCFFK